MTNSTRFTITIIPHGNQRYDTVGDYYTDADCTHIFVSDTGDWRSNMAVAVHELIESILCQQAGIDEHSIDQFDFSFQPTNHLEPGLDPKAPYHIQHMFATMIELRVAEAMGLLWEDHETLIEKLGAPDDNNAEE
jgi:hypothetical protein